MVAADYGGRFCLASNSGVPSSSQRQGCRAEPGRGGRFKNGCAAFSASGGEVDRTHCAAYAPEMSAVRRRAPRRDSSPSQQLEMER
ncbi:MAG: hypothetical protein ACLUEK_15875 [Oscillospiraceae bacterium]